MEHHRWVGDPGPGPGRPLRARPQGGAPAGAHDPRVDLDPLVLHQAVADPPPQGAGHVRAHAGDLRRGAGGLPALPLRRGVHPRLADPPEAGHRHPGLLLRPHPASGGGELGHGALPDHRGHPDVAPGQALLAGPDRPLPPPRHAPHPVPPLPPPLGAERRGADPAGDPGAGPVPGPGVDRAAPPGLRHGQDGPGGRTARGRRRRDRHLRARGSRRAAAPVHARVAHRPPPAQRPGPPVLAVQRPRRPLPDRRQAGAHRAGRFARSPRGAPGRAASSPSARPGTTSS